MSQANSHQVAGNHYQARYQHWDFVHDCLRDRYLEGQISKYVTRWRKKNGLIDVQKALHFLDKLIEEYDAGRIESMRQGDLTGATAALVSAQLTSFLSANDLPMTECVAITGLVYWRTRQGLEAIRHEIIQLVHEASLGDPTRRYVDQG